jgi:hypothetical protein
MAAYIDEAWSGVGTAQADLTGMRVQEAERRGTPLDDIQYQESEYYRPSVKYYRGMTQEAAKILADYSDDREQNAFIINSATTGQTIAGFAAGFGSGVFEPKNLAIGVGVSAVATPALGWVAPASMSVKRLIQMKRNMGNIGQRVYAGGVEGMVSAAIAEPSNRSSAGKLQQDYTMADTLWNIGTSTAFGAGLNAAHPMYSYVSDKFAKHGAAKGSDILVTELDTATAQLSQGKKIDVSQVEAVMMPDIEKLPVARQAKAAEQFVRYTETPEFKARFEGSKALSEAGEPIRGYRGRRTLDNQGREAIFFSDNPEVANTYSATQEYADVPNTQIAYFNMKNPLEVDAQGFDWHSIEFMGEIMDSDQIAAYAKENGHDGLIIKNVVDDLNAERSYGDTSIAVFSEDQIISAFGADDLETIKARMTEERTIAARDSVTSDLDPDNDTALDIPAERSLNEAEALMSDDDMAAVKDYEDYQARIAALEDSGVVTAKEELDAALADMNEADIEEAYKSLYACLAGR